MQLITSMEMNETSSVVVNKAVVLFLFLRLISLNLQTYLCLCVVSGHTPSQRALQEWPVLCLSPSVAAVVLHVMFDKRLKFQKNGLQSCWKPGRLSKGRRELRPVTRPKWRPTHTRPLSVCITLFIFYWVQCLLTQALQPSANSSSSNSMCLNWHLQWLAIFPSYTNIKIVYFKINK